MIYPQPARLPPSLYAETARPPVATPALDGDRRVACAIIGGGFTGLSAALHLAEKGVDAIVLEAREPGWGASGRNGGQVNPGLKHDPDRIERDFGPDLGSRMVALSWNAPTVVFDLIRRHQIACEARQAGTLRAAFDKRHAAEIRVSFEQGQRRGMPVELLEGETLRAATGTGRYLAAMLDRRGGHVNPLGYARGLADAALRAGARIYGGTPAHILSREGSVWRIQTPTGNVRAERVVLATNAYTDGLWPGLSRSVVPVYSGIVASESLSDDLARGIMPGRASLYEVAGITTYYRLDSSNRLLMGGRSPLREIEAPGELDYLRRYAHRLFPALDGIGWSHGWSGQLAITPSHYPHIHEPADGVIACLGYNGRGVAMATVMGQEIARRVEGGRSVDIDMPITTLKEIPFHGLWRIGVGLRVLYGRIRDRLGI
ncbi:MAG: FAD-binding oxidoreductase [Proteobacteria bacterium]|nr:FAD-binding oxidoreductase [Pseudomonadota bacterium]MBI3499501.1 FAD-binding oxidoreductase [Pseudomonadota bacterium]